MGVEPIQQEFQTEFSSNVAKCEHPQIGNHATQNFMLSVTASVSERVNKALISTLKDLHAWAVK